MATIVLPIANGYYKSASLPLSAQECVNWYPNISEVPTLNQESLLGTPGIELLATSGGPLEANRGGIEMDNKPYFVNGGSLYRLDETILPGSTSYTMTELGAVSGSGRVSMASNGTQLFILVPGGEAFIYNHVLDTFEQVQDPDFYANGNPQHVVFIDGYFVCTTDTRKFICSAINDGTSWNALDFGSAESDPDDVIAPIVYRNQLFIAGRQTMEAFQNIGGTGFPFQRTGLFLQKGVHAPFSLINTQDSFMFIGGGENESPAIWALAGNDTQKLSTIPIDTVLRDLSQSDLENVFAWTYGQNGAYFVGFTLPDTTLVLDLATNRWHERKSLIEDGLKAYRVSSICRAYNKVICADTQDGRAGEITPAVYREYGNTIIRRIATQPFQNNMKSLFVPSVELTVESGVGNTDAPEPLVMMEKSNDGKTWSDGRLRSIGKIGEYRKRAIWRRNGRVGRFTLFRFTLTDAVKPVIIQLTAEIIGGSK